MECELDGSWSSEARPESYGLIGGSGGWSVNRRDRGVLKGGLNQVDDLTLPAVSSQPPDPQVDCKLPHFAGTSKKRIHV